MHQGQIPVPSAHPLHAQNHKPDMSHVPISQPHINGATQNSVTEIPTADSIDELIATASKQADTNAATVRTTPQVGPKPEANVSAGAAPVPPAASAALAKDEATDEKNSKKDKEKQRTTRLVYSDNDTSPEEKMASLARYTFTAEHRTVVA
jgi:hypothetical protein